MYANQAKRAEYVELSGVPAGDAQHRLEIPNELAKLEKAVSFAEESLAEFVNRLESALRPPVPEPAPAPGN